MRISVIGCGCLGAEHASAMAELGREVVGIDVDARKVDELAAGSRFSTIQCSLKSRPAMLTV